MLTHDNFVQNVLATQEVFDFGPEDRALSFLPLSHVFERTVDYVYMHRGVSIVHVDLENLTAALPAMRPTVIAGVPRLYEKVRERVEARVASAPPARRRLFEWARRTGRAVNYAPLAGEGRPGMKEKLAYLVADRLVLGKVRAALGGRLRFAVSGGAPLSRDVLEFFSSMGVTIVEGYGLTETSPVIAANSPHGIKPGSVGRPLSGVEVKIAPDGEILTRGPCVMKGYFNNPEATAGVMEGGWFHTGDIGRLDAEGYLFITDRKKDLIVTSGGKNVAPQVVEAALKSTGIVLQALVIGNGRRFVTALVVPDPEVLEKLKREKGAADLSNEEAIEHPGVVAAFQEAIDEAMKDFASFEKVRKIKLLPAEFTIAGGELTPTMKVRRRAVEDKYRAAVDALYSEGAEGR